MWALLILLYVALFVGNAAALTIRLNFGSAEKTAEEVTDSLREASHGVVVDAATEILRSALTDGASTLPLIWGDEEP